MSNYLSKNIDVFPTSNRNSKYSNTSKSGAYFANIVSIPTRLVDIQDYIVDIDYDNNTLNTT